MKPHNTILKYTIICTMIGLLSINPIIAQDWYDTDWQYRRAVTIDNPGGFISTNYQVPIVLDSTFDFSKSNFDGGDIRITSSDGTTLISFWIEIWDPSNLLARIWIKLPVLSTSGDMAYIYYGNTIATSLSNGIITFHAYDGFETYDLGTTPTSNDTNPGQWMRYSGNPAIAPGSAGSWDDEGATYASVIYDDISGEYRMYYQGINSYYHQIGLATSPDGLSWTKHPGNPILAVGPPGSWDAEQVRVPMVWKEGPSDYHMIYSGRGAASAQIGYATSIDGVNWTKYAGNPVFNDPTWANNQTQNWGVMKVGTEYLMWYCTFSNRQSGIAVSSDLINWSPYSIDPIFASNGIPSDDRFSQFCPYSFRYNSEYYVLVPSYSAASNYAKFYLYKSSSPYFPEPERQLVRVVHQSKNGEIDATDNATPYLFTQDIERNLLPTDEIRLYYGAEPGDGWMEGILIETDITAALSDAPLPGGSLSWSGNAEVTNNPIKQGEKSVTLNNVASLGGSFIPLEQGVVGAWMNRTSSSAGDFDIYLYGEGGTLTCVAGLGQNGTFHYWNGTFQESTTNWTTDTWYLVTISYNCITNQYDFIVYDESLEELLQINSISFGNSSASISKGTLYTSTNYSGDAFADDFRVRKSVDTVPLILLGNEQNISPGIDIAVYNTSCGKFEVRLKPDIDYSSSTLSNIQFTLKWPENSVNLINFESDFGISQQGPVYNENDTNYIIFVSITPIQINWSADVEYTIFNFAHDQTGTGYGGFIIDTSDWSFINNGGYYVELLGSNQTGTIYQNAHNIYLGTCGKLAINAYLQGPFNSSTELMNVTLNISGNLPLNQPYWDSPWNYIGTESVQQMPADAVDWILIELRDAPDAASANISTRFKRQAALLLNDGTIIGTNGSSLLDFNNATLNKLFVVIWHRNHLGILSSTNITPSPVDLYNYNFTTAAEQAYGNGQLLLGNGIYGLIGGNANSDKYINMEDLIQSWIPDAGSTGYLNGDLDFDTQVNNLDKNDIWFGNFNMETQVPD